MTATPVRFATCIAFAFALFASAAFADAAKLTLEPAGPYQSGDSVRVRWSELPDEIVELEFLLVRGGRIDDVIRMTPQLDPRHGEFVWRVPALGADDASLVLRAGTGREEIEIAESGAFTIVSPSERDALLFRNGEWWEGDDTDPWTPATEDRIDTPHERVHPQTTVHASRVRGRVPVVIVETAAYAPAVVATYSPARKWSAAPRTVPQRK